MAAVDVADEACMGYVGASSAVGAADAEDLSLSIGNFVAFTAFGSRSERPKQHPAVQAAVLVVKGFVHAGSVSVFRDGSWVCQQRLISGCCLGARVVSFRQTLAAERKPVDIFARSGMVCWVGSANIPRPVIAR